MVPSPRQCISSPEIDILISAIQRIKTNDGDMDGTEIWFDNKRDPDLAGKCETCESENASGHHWFPKDAQECRVAMGQLKALNDSMVMLRNNVAQRLACLQRQHARLVLRDGIRSIPPEILAFIFRLAHLGGGHRVTETLSLVCTRFRDTCLRTPQMWSHLQNDFSPNKTSLNLNRSRDSALAITISHTHHYGTAGPDTTGFLELVTLYASRWVSLDIYTEDSCLKEIFSGLPILQLPQLARIRHNEETGQACPNGAGQYFYSKWNMPSLTSFEGTNVMPDWNFIGSNISYCKLYSVPSWDKSGQSFGCISMNDLTRSLRCLKSLQNLELDFHQINTATAVSPIAVLSNLQSLTLRFGPCMRSNILYELMATLSTPVLDTLHISISNHRIACACSEIFTHFETFDIFSNLKNFSLRTDHYNFWNPFLSELLRHSPLLRNLAIQVSFTSFMQDIGFVRHKHLQTVRFEKCDRLFEPQIKAMYKNWMGQTTKKVEVIKCKCLSEIFLSKWETVLKEDGVQLIWEV
ncbi:hypothetical protein BD410DRAFT_779430 [Rickenella mellea]|uniref:Uncharacterized protein n=1 Tax=Rickenella mellea TaxID=50990 RepID=A0A4R5XEF5_9AGAM|nr:hypothetical protein BD410DRAFT_779430 [Rickenella mellea]